MRPKVDADALLARLVRDARSEPVAGPEWDSVEESLLARTRQESATPKSERRTNGAVWVWAAAVAAAMIGGAALLLLPSDRVPAPRNAVQTPLASSALDGASLRPGAVVEASSRPVIVEHLARARWVLEPGSSARVQSVGEVIALELVRGAVSAHVTKSPRPESFVVVAGATRAAVHGTKFRVARVRERVHVEVTEGVVAVGPVGSVGERLEAPRHAVFTLEGRAETPVAVADPGQQSAKGSGEPAATDRTATGAPAPSSAHARPAHGASASLPATKIAAPEASRGDTDRALARAVSAVKACFASRTVAQGEVKITALTTLSLRVSPAGTVAEALFEPPLAPGVQQCIDSAMTGIRFPSTTLGLSLARNIELER